MPSAEPPSRPAPRRHSGRWTGRLLLGAVLGFAVLGAAALVVSDDARWLRLGIVAALWAALVGAFAAARYRREVAADHHRSEELRRVYELELEREVAARREYELEVEATVRRRVEAEVRTEIRGELDGLRTELRTLRQNLEALLGGEVLVERVALRAESTRLRSLSDQSRAARSADRALPHGPSYPEQPWHTGRWRREAMRALGAEPPEAEVIDGQHPPAERSAPRPVDPSWATRPRVEPSTEPLPAPPATGRSGGDQALPSLPDAPAAEPHSLTSAAWSQLDAWTPSDPPSAASAAATPAAANGNGSGGAGGSGGSGGYVGRRRRSDDEPSGRSTGDLLGSNAEARPRSRHRRDDE